ncbi:GAF domain-containing sensor histidine kinase [Nonomuraea fuscirosea]|uniref:GAF domain-containing sensor histidine kinase n=1 Tax=Nonomuraea fuscirosea TaxID=1291556 RepID=UPI003430E3E0
MPASRRTPDGDRAAQLDELCRMVSVVTGCDAVLLTVWEGPACGVGTRGLPADHGRMLAGLVSPEIDAEPMSRARPRDGAESSFKARLAELSFASSARVPITREGRVIGLLLVLGKGHARPDAGLLTALARVCESAIEYGRKPPEPPEPTELDALALSTDSFAELIAAIGDVVSRRFGPVGAGLSVFDDDTRLLLTADGSFGLPPSVTRRYWIDPDDLHSNAARVFELRQPFTSNRVIGDPAIIQSYPRAFGIRTMMALPLVIADRSIGVLMIVNKSGGFASADLAAVTPALPRISIAVELTRLAQRRRFAYEAERLAAELRMALIGGRLGDAAAREVLERTRELTAADHVILRRGSGSGAPAPGAVVLPCGTEKGHPMTLEAARAARPFGNTETELLTELARVVRESEALRRVRHQEEELVQHRERQRIADDLHDDVSQLLFAAQLALNAPTPDAGRVSRLIRQAEAALRDAIFVLESPPVPLSMELARLVRDVHGQWSLDVLLDLGPGLDDAVSPQAARELLRAARECLANAAKHARATRVELRLRIDEDGKAAELVIADDGVGLPGTAPGTPTGGHGLRSLRRRVADVGGEIRVGTGEGGTKVIVRLPIAEH